MKNFRTYMLLFFASALFAGCTSTARISKIMNSGSYSLGYLHDQPVAVSKKTGKVSYPLLSFNAQGLPDTTVVIKVKNVVVPLLVVNWWKSENKCIQGLTMYNEAPENFFVSALTEEMERSGDFSLAEADSADYQLHVNVDSISTVGPYSSSGAFVFLLFAYSYSYADVAGPALSTLHVSYQLKKGGMQVLANQLEFEQFTQQINRRYNNNKNLQNDYAISMVEAASFNIKKAADQMVAEINNFLMENPETGFK